MKEEIEKRLRIIGNIINGNSITDTYRLELLQLQMRLIQLHDDLYKNL